MPRLRSSLISRSAVSGEHLASLAYFPVVRNPLKSFNRRLITNRCRSLTDLRLMRCHSFALWSTAASALSAPSIARPKQSKNQAEPPGDVQVAALRDL